LSVVEPDLDDSRLADFVARHPDGTVFHHPAWLRTLSAEYKRGIVMLACENQNNELAGIFPLMKTRGVPMALFGEPAKPRLSSLPRTPLAGPLCNGREATRLLVKAAIEKASVQGVRLQIKTEGPRLDELADVAGAPWRTSFVLPLPEDPKDLRIGSSGARRKHLRGNVRRAESLGIRVRFASSEDDIRHWHGIYLRTMRRVVIPPRPLRCFIAMWRNMAPPGLMKVLLAERHRGGKTELLAGSIFLMHGRKVFYAFSACPAENFPLQPNDLIHWEAIHWAANCGYREYDLGEVPSDARQLAAYKSKWGGEERLLYRYYYPRTIVEGPDSGEISRRQKLFEKVWQWVPLQVTANLGDLIYSYL
jgi:CelD/BcsL family acetyltransferase involved in cellulose biosynthesis